MVYLTRKEHFNAAHRLFNPAWSDEQNEKIFGKCSNKNFHGHNYNLYITVCGIPNIETGMILNLQDLSKIINRVVIDRLDHKNLNLEVEFLKGIIPSTENLAMAIWDQLQSHLQGCVMYSIKLFETENNYVEYFGN
ncbi:MAG: 6-carboxytetrahydropterin synthase [Chitinophagales bacterium]|nr:6-carboxytetrahydropterin synthase [Chitinophagales bacterium]